MAKNVLKKAENRAMKKTIRPWLENELTAREVQDKMVTYKMFMPNGEPPALGTITRWAREMGLGKRGGRRNRKPHAPLASSANAKITHCTDILTVPGITDTDRLRLLRSALLMNPQRGDATPVQA